MWQHALPCPHYCLILPLSCPSPDVRSDQPGCSRITKRFSSYSVLGFSQGFRHTPQNHLRPGVRCYTRISSDPSADHLSICRFPERNKVPDFSTFSSLLRITTKYEMPIVRSQLLDFIHDAYPETFEGLSPSKPLGESVFSGPTPHPNEVLNLFIQQKLVSALPMAYYMATRRGPNSLMDRSLPRNATLSPEILQSAITGLMALREVEASGTRDLIFEPNGPHPCSTPNCPSRTPTGPAALAAYHKVFDRIVGSSQLGTKVLQVPEFYEDRGGEVQCVGHGICRGCVDGWESGHAELRKKAWVMLPGLFGLKS